MVYRVGQTHFTHQYINTPHSKRTGMAQRPNNLATAAGCISHAGWCMLNMTKKDTSKACMADSAESAYPLQPASCYGKVNPIQWDSKRASGECRVCERVVERRERAGHR